MLGAPSYYYYHHCYCSFIYIYIERERESKREYHGPQNPILTTKAPTIESSGSQEISTAHLSFVSGLLHEHAEALSFLLRRYAPLSFGNFGFYLASGSTAAPKAATVCDVFCWALHGRSRDSWPEYHINPNEDLETLKPLDLEAPSQKPSALNPKP